MSGRLSFGGLIRSEWIKLWSVRSTYWCLAIVVALTVLLGLLVGRVADEPTADAGAAALTTASTAYAVSGATLGLSFAQLVVAVLGALVVTGEYGSGMIRTTFMAAPRRIGALLAKALVFAVVTFVVGLVAELLATAVTEPILTGRGFTPDLGDAGFWWALLGGAGYLALVGVFALGLGIVLRSSAASIATAVGALFVLPIVGQLIARLANATWVDNVRAFLPSAAGGQMYSYGDQTSTASDVIVLSAWQGTIVMVAWVALFGVIGLVLAKRRDV